MARTPIHNRQDALENAMALFWRKGFHATSLKDLEHALDMRPGSIYATFGSKDALFQEALERYAERGQAEVSRIFAAHASPMAGLTAYIRGLGEIRDKGLPCPSCMLVKSLMELGDREQNARQRVEALLAGMEGLFVEQLRAAQAAGELAKTEDVTLLGRRLQSEVMGLRTFAQRNVSSEQISHMAHAMAETWQSLQRSH
ncbi:TetR/AcrR family transcriptional regulator [uncultured Microbulbifer sp.]|uniref:TetR/AcrR family transcriptional regulator n=1 Tax=uncultured Microbulbifer sp. TaxID=348147 RepID=UPI0026185D70|nr:TetR/AcrR family transcriptional regulator [uncultured Microbulbifer sp.]